MSFVLEGVPNVLTGRSTRARRVGVAKAIADTADAHSFKSVILHIKSGTRHCLQRTMRRLHGEAVRCKQTNKGRQPAW